MIRLHSFWTPQAALSKSVPPEIKAVAGPTRPISDWMNMSSVNEIRSKFLDFFAENGHEIVPSSPLVPRNDPTLMFTNAGMVQFKNVFTGVEKRPYQRATTSQKCVRAGGKHNDLDNVGYTARHHTFFEMLGNFSFGDYFKDRAIELAWNARHQGIRPAEGQADGRPSISTTTRRSNYWKKIAGLPDVAHHPHRRLRQFLAMGDTGPCGPCSEIFIRSRRARSGADLPAAAEQDGDRFIEFWNLVFMQFEQRDEGGERNPLPRPSIDTGMPGWSASLPCCRARRKLFDIDLFVDLIARRSRR